MAAKKSKKAAARKSLKNKPLSAVKPLTVYPPDSISRVG
jgi:hypothetical protein